MTTIPVFLFPSILSPSFHLQDRSLTPLCLQYRDCIHLQSHSRCWKVLQKCFKVLYFFFFRVNNLSHSRNIFINICLFCISLFLIYEIVHSCLLLLSTWFLWWFESVTCTCNFLLFLALSLFFFSSSSYAVR